MKNFCALKLQFTYVQATEEDFSPQREHQAFLLQSEF